MLRDRVFTAVLAGGFLHGFYLVYPFLIYLIILCDFVFCFSCITLVSFRSFGPVATRAVCESIQIRSINVSFPFFDFSKFFCSDFITKNLFP